MARRKVPKRVQTQVRNRARYLCEYCHAAEGWQYVEFTIDHIMPVAQGGTNEASNLALACLNCNLAKYNRTRAIDPVTKVDVPLYSPRRDVWHEHFVWSSDTTHLIGLTLVGRATIAALDINRSRLVDVRAADKVIGRHPPPDDPIESGENEPALN